MSEFDRLLLVYTLLVVLVGGWSVFWARSAPDAGRRAWGRRLFVATLLLLGLEQATPLDR